LAGPERPRDLLDRFQLIGASRPEAPPMVLVKGQARSMPEGGGEVDGKARKAGFAERGARLLEREIGFRPRQHRCLERLLATWRCVPVRSKMSRS